MMNEKPPIARVFDFADLSEAGYETAVAATPAEREALARWAEVSGMPKFEARISLERISPTRFRYGAALDAEVTQNCVVTLEPVTSAIQRKFHRELQFRPHRLADKGGEIALSSADDDAPEEIDSLRFDLAGPLLEELSLAIDPYPRAPGVVFEAPGDGDEVAESPFAVLKGLKQG